MGDGQHRHVDAQLLDLFDGECRALGVAGDNEDVRFELFDHGKAWGHVVEFRRQFVVDDDVDAEAFGIDQDAGPNILAERIVLEDRGERERFLATFGLGQRRGHSTALARYCSVVDRTAKR